MQKTCKQCATPFEVTTQDLTFYKKMSAPPPTLCPDCRLCRRLSHRNERKLYVNKCVLTGKQVISVYSPEKEMVVYDHDAWWSDNWNPLIYGRDFDFNKTFFEQFSELQKKVPHMNMIITHCENSDYAPYSVASKNCYMCVSVVDSEDLFYSYQTNHSRDCAECMLCYKCELCYECVHGVQLFNSGWTLNCKNSHEIYFCRDCQNCSNCIGCADIEHKKYFIFNKQATKEEYEKLIKKLKTTEGIQELSKTFEEFSKKYPQRENHNINCENCTGDHMINSKNSQNCFEAENLEDCAYMYTIPTKATDCYDTHYSPNAELVYEAMSAVNNYNTKFIIHSWEMKDSSYVEECFYSANLFGCVGLKHKKHCILNKEYSQEDYKNMIIKIEAHMRKTDEWGEFFPTKFSPFGYNETIAQDYFPLTKETATKNNYKWKD